MKRSAFLTSLLSLLGTPKLLGKGETPSCPSQTKAPADSDAAPLVFLSDEWQEVNERVIERYIILRNRQLYQRLRDTLPPYEL